MKTQIYKHNPKTRYRELQMLRNLGLEENEINYIVWLKLKNQRSSKFHH